MPDWILISDRDDNKYYIDNNGKIWTSGEPEFEYKPVSIDGLDYYLNQSIELIKGNYKTYGLTLLKSIMAMPIQNNRIYEAQCRASKEINYLIRKEGNRYNKLNDCASLLLYRHNEHITLINDKMQYSIIIPKTLKIIKRSIREKLKYMHYGILLGINFIKKDFDKKAGYMKYDILIAIDSERFASLITTIGEIEKKWRKILGSDTFYRKVLISSDNSIVYSYKDSHPHNYSGIEGFYYKGNYTYCLRTICSNDTFINKKEIIIKIVKSFKI